MPRSNLYSLLGVPSPTTFDAPHKYVTSPIPLLRSPLVLASTRMLIAIYTLATLLTTLIRKSVVDHAGDSYFSYFTYLTFTGLCAYYFAAGVQTTVYALAWRRNGAGVGYALQRWPRPLQALHVILQSSVITFPILVTIVFWALLASSSTFSTPYSAWSNISVHIFNTVFALFEILCTNSPPAPWITLPFCILFLAMYLGVAYITHATQGIYTYSFLDPQKQGPTLAAYIVGILVGYSIVFSLVRGVVVLRERWAMKNGHVLRVSGGIVRPSASIDDDWEEVESPVSVAKAKEDV
ncbi:hypothetical protein M413DRAFT_13279 [Hebeloma cylindrosporum]|uniref:Uncharacterized protein n=1 Tax=Hebeloma cylindrosporum TaxID=76867 RepID=A0A0C3C1N8_HEBCY|nr:hypothetical protein M413DRAFT_13279 [Hebeloma cylindrosporum h7]